MVDLTESLKPKNLDDYFPVLQIDKEKLARAISNATISSRILISGPTGCGKTTLAQIIAAGLNCTGNGKPCNECASCKEVYSLSPFDVHMIDSVSCGVKEMRDLRDTLIQCTSYLRTRVVILDESQRLTRDAQQQLLKILDQMLNVQFIFCTTEPEKMNNALRNRCYQIHLRALSKESAEVALKELIEKNNIACSKETIDKIIESSGGCPRQMIIALQSDVSGLLDPTETDNNTSLVKLAKEIMAPNITGYSSSWNKLMSLRSLQPEEVRQGFLKVFLSELRRNNSGKTANACELFMTPLEPSNPWADMMLRIYKINYPEMINRN